MWAAVLLPLVLIGAGVLRLPSLHQALLAIPLPFIIGVNLIRILGVTFLLYMPQTGFRHRTRRLLGGAIFWWG